MPLIKSINVFKNSLFTLIKFGFFSLWWIQDLSLCGFNELFMNSRLFSWNKRVSFRVNIILHQNQIPSYKTPNNHKNELPKLLVSKSSSFTQSSQTKQQLTAQTKTKTNRGICQITVTCLFVIKKNGNTLSISIVHKRIWNICSTINYY